MANLMPRNNDLMSLGDRFFDNFFANAVNNEFNVDIKETDQAYEVKADLPGFDKADLNVYYNDDVLTIEANRNDETEDKDEAGNFLRRERSSRSYRRQFLLKGADEDQVKATFKAGVLSLELPKAKNATDDQKKIEIE